MGQEEA